jgi:hypothetical protein
VRHLIDKLLPLRMPRGPVLDRDKYECERFIEPIRASSLAVERVSEQLLTDEIFRLAAPNVAGPVLA